MGDDAEAIAALQVICNQRTNLLRNRPPIDRVEMLNPYIHRDTSNITQFQYDMRRKTEILQYRSARMSSQTNSLTKKQQFALIARGNFIAVPASAFNTDVSFGLITDVSCVLDEYLPTPSTSAGVPGPAIMLYLDRNVPLYNYGAPQRSYPFSVSNTENTKFRTDTNNDLLAPHNQEVDFCMLTVNSNIDQPAYNFTFTFPLGIRIAGVIENNGINKSNPVTASVYQVILNIYYSNNMIQSVNIPSSTLSSLTFNIANQGNTPRTGQFDALLYIGSITSPRIRLLTQAGFIYQVKAIARLTTTGGGNNYFSNLSLYAIINKTNQVLTSENNCVITSVPSTIANNGCSVVAS